MIRAFARGESRDFFLRLGKVPFLSAEMAAGWQVCADARFYRVGEHAVLQIRGAAALLCGRVENGDELTCFLGAAGVRGIRTDGFVPSGWHARMQNVLTFMPAAAPEPPLCPQGFSLYKDFSLFAAARACFPGAKAADAWAADACMRRNRGIADIRALYCAGEPAAMAGIFSLQPWEAYLAGVVTAPCFRGQGCARYLTALLAHAYAGAYPVRLVCDDVFLPLYLGIGFTKSSYIVESIQFV